MECIGTIAPVLVLAVRAQAAEARSSCASGLVDARAGARGSREAAFYSLLTPTQRATGRCSRRRVPPGREGCRMNRSGSGFGGAVMRTLGAYRLLAWRQLGVVTGDDP